MSKLGIRCVRRAVSGADLTDFGKAVCVSLLLVLSCVLSPAFAQDASAGCTPDEGRGSSSTPYRIDTLCELQGISSSPTAHYELVANIDASETVSWNDGAGFRPIASTATDGFSGSFVNASDHEISSLTISLSAENNVGLFSRLANGATLTGIRLVDSRITGSQSVGLLVGENKGVIEDCSATGSVSGIAAIGGLVGDNLGDISGSSATGSVSGYGNAGGLVGNQGEGASINNSFATGTVFGLGDSSNIGGLVGTQRANSNINNSYATGLVSGANKVGGLVGTQGANSSISGSYATGLVDGANKVGGLIGEQGANSNINNSFATGSVSGYELVGGLVGSANGSISNSYATGSVPGFRGSSNIGGLVGGQGANSNINNSFATGSVSGQERVGGLVGSANGSISNSYATGSVFGRGDNVGGLVGLSEASISNSYYAARGQNNSLGEERTFTQLRCPMVASATCSLPGSDQRTYEDWDTSVWGFGSDTEFPQLLSNRNSDLNQKPYIKGPTELVVGTGFPGITRLSLEADYPGTPVGSVVLTWSLLFDEPSALSDFVYFELENGTTSTEASGSALTLAVVRDDLMEESGFYVVLKNNISANDDQVRVRTTAKQPYILRDDGIRLAEIEVNTTFGFSVGYTGSPGVPVTLTWSLSGVPTTLRHLVYFELGNDTTSTTVTDPGKLTSSARSVTLVVVGNKELAGISFYVVLKNDISDSVDRVRVDVEEEKQPYILRDGDIRPAPIGSTSTFSFSVGYAGTPGKPVTLTWSLSGVPATLRHLVYFELGNDTTDTMVTDPGKITSSASTATLVVVGNKELAGRSFYVVLENDISDSVDQVLVQVRPEVAPPNIVRDDDIRPAPVGSTTTFGFSVDYTGFSGPVTLTWSLSDVPSTLRHLVYFDLAGGSTSTTVTDGAKLTSSASTVTLVVVGNKKLAGRSFYVVLKNNISAGVDRVLIRVWPEVAPPNIVRDDDIRPAPVGSTTTFSFSVGYTGSAVQPLTLTWSLSGVPFSLRHLVYFDLGGGTTSITVTDSGKLTGSASTVTLVVVGDEELAGRSFYVVLKNNFSASDDRVQVRTEVGPPNIVQDNDIRTVPIGSTTTFGFSVGYTGSSDPVTLTWSLEDVPTTLRHLVYFDLGGGTTGTTVTDSAKLTSSASPVTLVVVGDEGLAGKDFYVVLKNNVSASDDRIQVLIEEDTPNILGDDDRPVPIGSTTTFSFSVGYTGSSDPVTLTWSLSGVPTTLRHLVYFDLGDGTTSTTVTDGAKLTSSARSVMLTVVGNVELAGRSFYVVLKNNVFVNVDRVRIQIQGPTAIRLRAKVYLGGAVR